MPVSSAACQSSAVARIALPQRQRERRSWSAPIRTSASVSVASRTSGIDSSPTLSTAPPYDVGMERSSAVQRRTASACSASARPKPISSEFLMRVSSCARTTKPKSPQ